MSVLDRVRRECPMAIDVLLNDDTVLVTVAEPLPKKVTDFLSEQTLKEARELGYDIATALAYTSEVDKVMGNYNEFHEFSDDRESIITEIEDQLPFLMRKGGQLVRRAQAKIIAAERGLI